MNRSDLLLVPFLVGLLHSNRADAQVALGFKAGANYDLLSIKYNAPNIPGYTISLPPDVKAAGPGFHTGAYLNTTGSGKTGLILEVLYSRRSSVYDYDYELDGSRTYEGSVRYRLEYVELPVLFNGRVSNKLQLQFGFAAALVQSASSVDEGTVTYAGPSGSFTSTYKDRSNGTRDMTKVALDIAGGADLEFLRGLHGTIRYLMDLNNLDSTGDTDSKSRLFQLSIGYDLIGRQKG